jgi:hypothetical protein
MNSKSINSALRAWAQACHPDSSPEELLALPVASLLPGLGAYLQALRLRVTQASLKPLTALETLQHQAAGCSSSSSCWVAEAAAPSSCCSNSKQHR